MASSRIGMMYRVSVKVCPNQKVLTFIPRVIVSPGWERKHVGRASLGIQDAGTKI